MHPEELKENVQAIHDNLTGRIKELESALSHSRQEIEELKTENEKLREALKMCLNYMDATSIKKGYMKIDEIETARKLIEG